MQNNELYIKKLQAQIVIAGAGPAGAMASIFLSKAGIHHTILEKEIFPRDKVCGDACSGKTVFVLKKANPAWLDEIFLNSAENLPCHGVIFTAPDGQNLTIPFHPESLPQSQAAGFITPRLIFDNFLFKKITSPYATIFQQADIQKIERQNNKLFISFTQSKKDYLLETPLVIGADGDKGIVRKTFINNKEVSKSDCIGLRGYYKNVSGFHKNNFIELHFLPELLPGYLWIFPLTNGLANVGVGMPAALVRKNKLNLRDIMLHAIKNNPVINSRFKNATLTNKIQGWGLPTCIKQGTISGNNFLLAGDAAGLIDPFTGEGIGNALYSGMMAAAAAEKIIKSGNYTAAFIQKNYDDILYKHIGDELKTGAVLQKLSSYRWLFNFVVRKANKSKTLNSALTSMFTDLDLKKQIRRPSFYAKIIFNK